MRTIVFVALACCVLLSREAAAQDFFYAPPGYGDYYGASLGNGVGFGYGIGIGLSPSVLNSSVTDTYVPPFQELCDSNPSFISRGTVVPPQMSVFQNPPMKKTKMATTKKNASKVTLVKGKTGKQSVPK